MNTKAILFLIFSAFLTSPILAQMPGPGAKRDMEKIRELEKQSVLRNDSVRITDRVTVVDPITGAANEQVVISVYSIYDYCQQLLGISSPDKLLNGEPMQITDPLTYEPIKVRWNAGESRIDTIPQ